MTSDKQLKVGQLKSDPAVLGVLSLLHYNPVDGVAWTRDRSVFESQ
jgi:hypothetical protein